MDAETKLQEMCDRGWHIKFSRQKSSATWDVVGALDGWSFRSDEHTYCTFGIHTSLLSALLDMEKMLIDAEIQNLSRAYPKSSSLHQPTKKTS